MSDQDFLRDSELEFRALLIRLGHDKWTADLRAFQLTQALAAQVKRLRLLWNAAHERTDHEH